MYPTSLRLYVAGDSDRSTKAKKTVYRLLAREGGERIRVEVVDVLADPERAERDKVVATPVVRVETGARPRVFVGDGFDGLAELLFASTDRDGPPDAPGRARAEAPEPVRARPPAGSVPRLVPRDAPTDRPRGLKIGEVSRRSGFSRQTLHNYTQLGLIRTSGRTKGGHRLYAESVLARLTWIDDLRKEMRLEDIRGLIEREERGRHSLADLARPCDAACA